MLTLGLDTAGGTLAIGLVQGDEVIVDLQVAAPQAHSRLLPALVQATLAAAEVPADQVGLVAVAAGPGSYTGLRLGAMAAKVLAWWARGTIVGVDSLQVLAAPLAAAVGSIQPGAEHYLAALLPSRRGRVYGRLYHVDASGTAVPRGPLHENPAAAVAVALAAEAAGSPLLLLGGGSRAHTDEMQPLLPAGSRWADPAWDAPRGSWVARLGTAAATGAQAVDPLAFVPAYPGPGIGEPPHPSPRRGGSTHG